jgi:hypothetical protein
MSRINLNNYEAFVLDHLEGRLNAEESAALKAFLVLHPELNVDLENNELPYLENEHTTLSGKEDLKKEPAFVPSAGKQDEQIISYIEGLLNEEQRKAFEKKVENDEEYRSLFNIYAGTKLLAESSVVFEGKDSLLRSEQAWINNDAAFNYLENELSAAEKIAFEKELLSDQTLSKEFSLYTKTKLAADLAITYPRKEELKKEAAVIALFSTRTILSIAAAILLIIGLIVIFNVYNSGPELKKEFAKKDLLVPNNNVKENKIENNSVVGPNIIENKEEPKTYASKNPFKEKVSKKDTAKLIRDKLDVIGKEIVNVPEEEKNKNVVDPGSLIDTLGLAKIKNENKNEIKNEALIVKEIPKPVILLAYENDDEAEVSEEPKKPGLWQRLAKAAGQANKLGMKAVNGNEGEGQGYLLSLSSLSIQKK